jgi:hypothetical protein
MKLSEPPSSRGERPAANDSPWFWASMFLTGALVAMTLAGPKFSWRQPQIERQFQARQRSGHSVSPSQGPSPYTQSVQPTITLFPLFLVLGLLLTATWSVWIWQRFGRRTTIATNTDTQASDSKCDP